MWEVLFHYSMCSLGGLWGTLAEAQGAGGVRISSKSAGGDLLTPCPVITVQLGCEDPGMGRDVNSWLSICGVCGLLGELSGFSN